MEVAGQAVSASTSRHMVTVSSLFDESPLAIEDAKRRGVTHAVVRSLTDLGSSYGIIYTFFGQLCNGAIVK